MTNPNSLRTFKAVSRLNNALCNRLRARNTFYCRDVNLCKAHILLFTTVTDYFIIYLSWLNVIFFAG